MFISQQSYRLLHRIHHRQLHHGSCGLEASTRCLRTPMVLPIILGGAVLLIMVSNCVFFNIAGQDLFKTFLEEEGCYLQLTFLWACEGLKCTGILVF